MIEVMHSFGEVGCSPFKMTHTSSALAKRLKILDGEACAVMEATSNYYFSITMALHKARLYVSVVNTFWVHDYGNNTLWRATTDKKTP